MPYTIRDVRPADAEVVHEILVSEHVRYGTMRLPYLPLSTTVARIEPSDDATRLVALDGDTVVGFVELMTYPGGMAVRHRHVGQINMIATHADWVGRGVGRALMEAIVDMADNWLQLRRTELLVWSTNDRAIALYESLGFEHEGTLRDYVFTDGTYVDARMMARIHG